MIKLKQEWSTNIDNLIYRINNYHSKADDVEILVDRTEFSTWYVAVIKYRSKDND